MTDQRDVRMRALVVELVETAPPAPPFPTTEVVAASPRRPLRALFVGAVVVVLLAAVIGAIALFGDDREGRPPVVTTPPTTGSAVAYVGEDGLYVVPAGGGGVRRVAEGEVLRPRWSYDGKYVAYNAPNKTGNTVRVVDIEGGSDRHMVSLVERWEWAPDRDALAFLANGDLFVETADGRSLGDWQDARDFAWAPDGSLFLTKPVGGPTDGRILHDELFHARLGATTLERLGVTFPTSTPNYGLFLAGTSPAGDPVVWVDEYYSGSGMMDGPPLYVVRDGRAIRLGSMRLQRSWVTWTPSRSQFAFVETGARMVTDPRAVKVCDATIACVALRTDGSQTTDPAWSPDGSRLAFVRNDASTDPNDFVHDGAPDWSTRYASRRLWIANAGRLSSAREAAWAGRGVGAPTWVSDHELVYTRADGALMLADVDAHHVQKVGSLALPDEAPPSQVYDPSDANAEVQWTDLFAVAPSS